MRDMRKMRDRNDGTRSLMESIMAPEVMAALRDWSASEQSGVLICGVALSFYVKPRYTEDVDLLYLSDEFIPPLVDGFKRTRGHAFEHRGTNVEVEIVIPSHVNVSPEIFKQVIDTARESDNIKVASPSGLVALKLERYNMRDRADIVDLIQTGEVDISGFSLGQRSIARYVAACEDASNES